MNPVSHSSIGSNEIVDSAMPLVRQGMLIDLYFASTSTLGLVSPLSDPELDQPIAIT